VLRSESRSYELQSVGLARLVDSLGLLGLQLTMMRSCDETQLLRWRLQMLWWNERGPSKACARCVKGPAPQGKRSHSLQKSVANHVIRPRIPYHCHRLWFSLACEPNYLAMRVDYSSFTLSIEVMSRELRKDSNPGYLFEQAEVRSR
jgi:hypothetical protein